jgi:CheY-like chemotaxis protein
MISKKILIVDDNKVDRTALCNLLKPKGYELILAEDGADAINTARREKLDLIILDIIHPPDVAHGGGVPWDGFLILSWMRRIEQVKDVPVIFVSGGSPLEYQEKAAKAGAVAFFKKPFTANEFLKAVSDQLSSRSQALGPRKRVLFVDDEGDWRLVAGSCLEDAGFQVVTAKDQAEALKRMECATLDGIVLDLNLAGQNGLLLMELLKQMHPGVPILIYTGQDLDKAAVQSILAQGARQYLKKGSMAELCSTLKAMVN